MIDADRLLLSGLRLPDYLISATLGTVKVPT